MKLWVWDVIVFCLVWVEGFGCFLIGVGLFWVVFFYILYIIFIIFFFEYICMSIFFFLLSNVLIKLEYGFLY